MVDVPLRHRSPGRRPSPPPPPPLPRTGFHRPRPPSVAHGVRRPRWPRLLLFLAAIALAILGLGYGARFALDAYRGSLTLTGLSDDATAVALTVAGETLAVPGNMLRDEASRAGGTMKSAELVLHWPTLDGYSTDTDSDFRSGSPSAPLVYLTIAPRTVAIDAAGRLDSVYARYFVGDLLAAPPGLTARRLSLDSGYDGEIVYYGPPAAAGGERFVARCLPEATADTPATCLRDLNIGRNLTLLYRFNRDIIASWQDLDQGIQKLAARLLAAH